MTEYLTRKQVAFLIGVDHSTISRWEKKGLIPVAQRFNGMCLYTPEEIEQIREVSVQQQALPEGAVLCSICNQRQARRNSVNCSRCSVSRLKQELRSTLPMEPDPNQMNLFVEPIEEIEDAANPITQIIQPGEKQYTRNYIAQAIGVSPSSIARWEKKGATPMPFRLPDLTYIYTEEIFHKIIDYAELQKQHQRSPIERAAKLSSKSFGRAERAVARTIRNFGGRGVL